MNMKMPEPVIIYYSGHISWQGEIFMKWEILLKSLNASTVVKFKEVRVAARARQTRRQQQQRSCQRFAAAAIVSVHMPCKQLVV
jgi:hypothetical protein